MSLGKARCPVRENNDTGGVTTSEIGQVWHSIIIGLIELLRFITVNVPPYNAGVAIILLTVAMRVVLLPVTIKQTKSMYEMQQAQPKLRELQQKYKNDKERQQKEMMKFYQENKINPFGGCVPLLLQFPIMIALFRALTDKAAVSLLGQAPFLGMNLTKAANAFPIGAQPLAAAPYLVMIVLMMLTTYLPQKMMTSDPQQGRTMLFMTAFMGFIAWSLPSGVLLYWIVTNVWTMGQQYLTLKPQGGQDEKRGK